MKLILGSDKSGYPLRKALEEQLTRLGYELTLLGPESADQAVPFYEVAPKAAQLIQSGEVQRGILICGTGMGMAQVAGKFQGIRAACVESVYAARMCRVINDSNLLCMGGWVIAPEMAIAMTEAYLAAEFVVGVEDWRKAWLENAKSQIAALEEGIYGG